MRLLFDPTHRPFPTFIAAACAAVFLTATFASAAGGRGSDAAAGSRQAQAAGLPQGSSNSPLIVTTAADHDDGTCNADCTLREAINAANANAGDDIVRFSSAVTGTIQLSGPLPALSSNITIEGPGADRLKVRRDTGGNYRVFTVQNSTVRICGLTIENGRPQAVGVVVETAGGGILNDRGTLTVDKCVLTGNASGDNLYTHGGAIFNREGTLRVVQSTFTGNSGFYGGAISSQILTPGTASVTVRGSTFHNNTAVYGGGIFNAAAFADAVGNASIVNSTFTGNDTGTNGFGGAIFNSGAVDAIATLLLTNCTFSANTAGRGGGVFNYNNGAMAEATVRNSVFKAGALGANLDTIDTTFISQGHNLSSDAAGGDEANGPGGFLNAAGDIRNTEPMLGPLQDNGGPTATHALEAGSPAVQTGNIALAPPIDQRGVLRGPGSDRGAFELMGSPLRITAITRQLNGDVRLQARGVPNANHQFESASSLGLNTFSAPVIVMADNTGMLEWVDGSTSGQARRFYRLLYSVDD